LCGAIDPALHLFLYLLRLTLGLFSELSIE
jgi:hypothetical protein